MYSSSQLPKESKCNVRLEVKGHPTQALLDVQNPQPETGYIHKNFCKFVQNGERIYKLTINLF